MENKSYCYIVKKAHSEVIKIGKSTYPRGRIQNLNTSSDEPLFCLSIFDEDDISEKSLHEKFREHRKNGEWFDFTTEIKEFIYNESYKQNIVDQHFKESIEERAFNRNEHLRDRVSYLEMRLKKKDEELKTRDVIETSLREELYEKDLLLRQSKFMEISLENQQDLKKGMVEYMKECSEEIDAFMNNYNFETKFDEIHIRAAIANLWMSLTKNMARFIYFHVDSSTPVMSWCKRYRNL